MSDLNACNLIRCKLGDENDLSLVGRATFLETFAGVLDGKDIQTYCVAGHAPDIYAAWLVQPQTHIWMACVNPGSAPIGYVVLARAQLPVTDLSESDREIKRIYLLHRFHGAGIGKQLLVKAVGVARELGAKRVLLGVYAGNTNAIVFYQRNGFRQVGTRHFRVGDNAYDDNIFALEI